jgi:hypothetical protein
LDNHCHKLANVTRLPFPSSSHFCASYLDTTIERTGSIEHFPTISEEGKTTNTDNEDDNVPDLLHPDNDHSVSTSGCDDDDDTKLMMILKSMTMTPF